MANPSIGHQQSTDSSSDLGKLLIAILVVPAPFELVNAFAKKESYDFNRLAVVVGGLLILAVAVVVFGRRKFVVQSVLGYYLVVLGAALTAFGVLVTFHPAALLRSALSPTVETTLSALTPSAGLLAAVGGIYLIRDQRRRIREGLEDPSPATIANPRRSPSSDRTCSLTALAVGRQRS